MEVKHFIIKHFILPAIFLLFLQLIDGQLCEANNLGKKNCCAKKHLHVRPDTGYSNAALIHFEIRPHGQDCSNRAVTVYITFEDNETKAIRLAHSAHSDKCLNADNQTICIIKFRTATDMGDEEPIRFETKVNFEGKTPTMSELLLTDDYLDCITVCDNESHFNITSSSTLH